MYGKRIYVDKIFLGLETPKNIALLDLQAFFQKVMYSFFSSITRSNYLVEMRSVKYSKAEIVNREKFDCGRQKYEQFHNNTIIRNENKENHHNRREAVLLEIVLKRGGFRLSESETERELFGNSFPSFSVLKK